MSKETLVRIFWVLLGVIVGVLITVFILFNQGMSRSTISINGQQLDVYVAQTDGEHQQGLSNIKLDEFDADGMLFVFDDSDERTFWMKDMTFAIDIIWVHDELIVKMEENIPVSINGDVSHMNSKPFEIDVVLELPAGGVDKYEINIGDKILLGN